jgi:cell division protein FtsI (penicillin-binding protein 3)
MQRRSAPPPPSSAPDPDVTRTSRSNGPLRTLLAMAVVALAFAVVAGQLVRLALPETAGGSASMSEAVGQTFARPDIVDRNGRLLATDVEAYSLFADPSRVIDRDEIVEKLGSVFADFDREGVREALGDRKRRFAWIKRGLSPKTAQRVHDLGLPGLDFRTVLKRAYPGATLAGHMLGYTDVDNKGVAGIERYIDAEVGVESVHGATLTERAPVRVSLDIGVQHAVENELESAVARYEARGAAGIVLDVDTGEVLASASYPQVDPGVPAMSLDPVRTDKVAGSTYELGSVFKTLTVAMALDGGFVELETMVDVRAPLTAGRFTIRDLHPAGRPLSVAEVFIHSSNVGAAKLALQAGPQHLQTFLQRMQLLGSMRTEAGSIAAPQLPERWGEVETMTVAYGHGIAVAPLQFAAAAAALVNGGNLVIPTYIKQPAGAAVKVPIIMPETSQRMRELMRRNVTDPAGTGKRANVEGYEVGGKTGTAEMPGRGGYRKKAVISSFLAAFPMSKPKYLVLVALFEPKPTGAASNEVLAGLNAAPTAGQIIARIGPLLGMLPKSAAADGRAGMAFDAGSPAKYETQ